MEIVDQSYDQILKVNFTLYKTTLKELKVVVQSWYKGIDFKKFDERKIRNSDYDEKFRKNDLEVLSIIKECGIISNYFVAYRERETSYLLDGFNRLLTEYGDEQKDTTVYLKEITTPLKDNELMNIMLYLNMWKLFSKYHEFSTHDFLDRGLRLLLYKKYGIEIYMYDKWQDRIKNKDDFEVLENYFKSESEIGDRWKYSYPQLKRLLSNENIIIDLKEIMKTNNYLTPKFNHYDKFVNGFITFLSRERLRGNNNKIEFETYLNKLEADKFYKKLIKMSWTDCTRKNIYNYFEGGKTK